MVLKSNSFKDKLILPSKVSQISKTCEMILSLAKKCGFTEDDIFAIHLSLEEGLVNAIKHGNKLSPDKVVTFDYSIDPNEFKVAITDQGPGFNISDVPDCREEENIWRSSGRGLLLMQAYMDVVEYNKSGNTVKMLKKSSQPKNNN